MILLFYIILQYIRQQKLLNCDKIFSKKNSGTEHILCSVLFILHIYLFVRIIK